MTYDIAAPVLMFLFGLVAGHWLSLGREKRKEFNEVADRLRGQWLEEQMAGDRICASPSSFDLDLFRRLLRPWQRDTLDRALIQYRAAKNHCHQDDFGQPFASDPRAVSGSLRVLLRLTTRR